MKPLDLANPEFNQLRSAAKAEPFLLLEFECNLSDKLAQLGTATQAHFFAAACWLFLDPLRRLFDEKLRDQTELHALANQGQVLPRQVMNLVKQSLPENYEV